MSTDASLSKAEGKHPGPIESGSGNSGAETAREGIEGKLSRIQILRFLAASAVVLSHALGTSSTYYGQSSYLEIFRHGDLGVDLFFVISGFVIGLSTLRGHTGWKPFLSRRLIRVVPLYWIVTLITAAVFFIPKVSRTPPPDAGYVLCSLTYSCWTRGQMPIVYPGWSLEFEIFFYLLVAVILFLRLSVLRSAGAILCSLVLLGALYRWLAVPPVQIVFLTDPIMLEFAAGLMVAYFYRKEKVGIAEVALLLIALAAAVVSGSDRAFRLCVAGVPSALLVYFVALRDRSKPLSLAGRNPLVYLGDASYAIYLVQALMISAIVKIGLKFTAILSQDMLILLAFLATLLVAVMFDIFADRPVTRLLKGLFLKSGRRKAASV